MVKAKEIMKELDTVDLRFSIHNGRIAVTIHKEPEPLKPEPLKEARSTPVKEKSYKLATSDIARALEASQGSVTRAARLLGVYRQSLDYMIEHRPGLRELRAPKKKRLKSIIKIKEGGARCFRQNPF
jgi:transcriptional regulator with GAF, ATPase, and Fis domain